MCLSTTRPKREGEIDGQDYHFVDAERFAQMVEDDELAEWAEVHGNRYGTARATINEAISDGRDVLFDIDWQGGMQLRGKYQDDTVMVFILPPTMAELARRLRSRGTDAPEMVERRLAKAADELTHHGEYDYLITNDDLDAAYDELRAVYLAAHCQGRRRAPRALELIDEARRSA